MFIRIAALLTAFVLALTGVSLPGRKTVSEAPADKGPVYFPHEYVDTSPYVPEEKEEPDMSLDISDRPRAGEEGGPVPEGSFACGDYVYSYVIAGKNKGTVYVTEYTGTETDVVIPAMLDGHPVTGMLGTFRDNDAVRSVVIPEGCTFISSNTFSKCYSLERAVIPDSVVSIAGSAFYQCAALQEAALPPHLEELGSFAFSGCASLRRVDIPEGLAAIGSNAFEACSSLQEIAVPDSVTELGNGVFQKCAGLKKAALGRGVSVVPVSCFSGCSALETVSFGGEVTAIENTAFARCGFASFTVPASVTAVGTYAFRGCEKLREASLPASLPELPANAFYGCAALERFSVYGEGKELCSVDGTLYSGDGRELVRCPAGFAGVFTVPEGTGIIRDFAFSGSGKLTGAVLPDSVTAIGNRAFYGCEALSSVHLGRELSSLGAFVFEDCRHIGEISVCPGSLFFSAENGLLTDRSGVLYYAAGEQPAALAIPDGVTEIGAYAFAGHGEITSVAFPESLAVIGTGAFSDCVSLGAAVFGGHEREIENNAFSGCASLKGISLPESLETLGQAAFSGCTALEGVTLPGGLALLDGSVFADCASLSSVEIPAGVTKIAGAFRNAGLASVTVPDGVSELGESFRGCASLKKAVVGRGVKKISTWCFEGCSALEELYYPAGLEFRIELIRSCPSLKTVYYGGTQREWERGLKLSEQYPVWPGTVTVYFSASPDAALQ